MPPSPGRRWCTHIVLQLLWWPLKGWSLKWPSTDRQRTQLSWVPQYYIKQQQQSSFQGGGPALTKAIPHRLYAGGAGRNGSFPVSAWKGVDCVLYSLSYCLRFQFLISLHVGADWNFPRSLTVLVGMSPAVVPWLTPTVKPGFKLLPGGSLLVHPAPQQLWLPPKELVPKSPSFGAWWGLAVSPQDHTKQRGSSVWAHKISLWLCPLTKHRVNKQGHPAPGFSLIGARLHS